MSESNRGPDDRELEQFLSGDSELLRRYRETRESSSTPPHLDRAVLDFAKQELSAAHRKPRWRQPLALAASLVLGVGVLLALLRDPEVRRQVAMERVSPPPPRQAPMVITGNQRPPISGEPEKAIAAAPAPSVQPQAPKPLAQKKESPPPEALQEQSSPTPAPPPPPAPGAGPAADMAAAPAPPMAAFSAAPQSSREVIGESRLRAQRAESRPEQEQARAKATAIWQLPTFQGLRFDEATREMVRARLGEPSRQGISRTQAAQESGDDDLPFDLYERIPGVSGATEFYYERGSARLLTVRVRLPASTTLQSVLRDQGWREAPLVRHGERGPCVAAAAADAAEYPQYLVFPGRGAYLVSPAANVVSEIVFERSCP